MFDFIGITISLETLIVLGIIVGGIVWFFLKFYIYLPIKSKIMRLRGFDYYSFTHIAGMGESPKEYHWCESDEHAIVLGPKIRRDDLIFRQGLTKETSYSVKDKWIANELDGELIELLRGNL